MFCDSGGGGIGVVVGVDGGEDGRNRVPSLGRVLGNSGSS